MRILYTFDRKSKFKILAYYKYVNPTIYIIVFLFYLYKHTFKIFFHKEIVKYVEPNQVPSCGFRFWKPQLPWKSKFAFKPERKKS